MDWKTRYEAATVPKRHQYFRTTDNKSEDWAKSYERLKGIIKAGGIACLIGDRGRGKTQAGACSIGFVCHDIAKIALYSKAFDIFLSIRNGNNPNSGSTEAAEIERYIKPHYLVIDAFEVRGSTDFENRVLDHIIDRRYDDQKPTAIITNDTIETFSSVVGPSIISRIKENGGAITFKGESFRG